MIRWQYLERVCEEMLHLSLPMNQPSDLSTTVSAFSSNACTVSVHKRACFPVTLSFCALPCQRFSRARPHRCPQVRSSTLHVFQWANAPLKSRSSALTNSPAVSRSQPLAITLLCSVHSCYRCSFLLRPTSKGSSIAKSSVSLLMKSSAHQGPLTCASSRSSSLDEESGSFPILSLIVTLCVTQTERRFSLVGAA